MTGMYEVLVSGVYDSLWAAPPMYELLPATYEVLAGTYDDLTGTYEALAGMYELLASMPWYPAAGMNSSVVVVRVFSSMTWP